MTPISDSNYYTLRGASAYLQHQFLSKLRYIWRQLEHIRLINKLSRQNFYHTIITHVLVFVPIGSNPLFEIRVLLSHTHGQQANHLGVGPEHFFEQQSLFVLLCKFLKRHQKQSKLKVRLFVISKAAGILIAVTSCVAKKAKELKSL